MRELIGKKFGKLIVVSDAGKNKRGQQQWNCQCDCGSDIRTIKEWYLINHSQSCGCEKKIKPRTALIGKRFGKLVVISFSHIHNRATWWNCQCDCGNKCVAGGSALTESIKQSCGCLQHITGKTNKKYKGHEEISSTLWTRIINGSKNRGRNRNKKIKFDLTIKCAWETFLSQDRKCALTGIPLNFPINSSKPSSGNASLDRIDSRKGYVNDNIQWVHKDINMMKHVYDQNYFIEMCKKVSSNN